MKTLITMLVGLALFNGSALAQGYGTNFPWRDVGVGAAQFGAAAVGGDLLIVGAGTVGIAVAIMSTGEDAWFAGPGGTIVEGLALASVGAAPAAMAAVTCWVGSGFYDSEARGSFGAATGGAYLGTLAGLGIGIAGTLASHRTSLWPGPWYIPALFLPEVGAVLGYHLSRPGPGTTGVRNSRFDLPSVALWPEKSGLGKTSPVLDARLLTFHF